MKKTIAVFLMISLVTMTLLLTSCNQSMSVTESENVAESKAETVTKAETESETVTKAETESETVTKAETESETVTKAETESESVTKEDVAHSGTNEVLKCEHNYEVKIKIQADCTTDGIKTFTCSKCKDSYDESIVAKGHKEVVDKAIEATCTQAGKTEGKHCSTCNKVLVEQKVVASKGHNEVIDKGVEVTCTQPGKTEGKHCSTCNIVLIEQKDLEATGHKEVIDESVEATCGQSGITEGKHCSVCNKIIVEQTIINPTGKHYGQNKCRLCNVSFFDMTKEILAASGSTYYSGDYTIRYNSMYDRIEIVYKKTLNNKENYFIAVIERNSSYVSWELSQIYDKEGFYNGQYICIGRVEEYMGGDIEFSKVSSYISSLDYSYNIFSTDEYYVSGSGYYTSDAKREKGNAAIYLRTGLEELNKLIKSRSNNGVTLYNLGFDMYD